MDNCAQEISPCHLREGLIEVIPILSKEVSEEDKMLLNSFSSDSSLNFQEEDWENPTDEHYVEELPSQLDISLFEVLSWENLQNDFYLAGPQTDDYSEHLIDLVEFPLAPRNRTQRVGVVSSNIKRRDFNLKKILRSNRKALNAYLKGLIEEYKANFEVNLKRKNHQLDLFYVIKQYFEDNFSIRKSEIYKLMAICIQTLLGDTKAIEFFNYLKNNADKTTKAKAEFMKNEVTRFYKFNKKGARGEDRDFSFGHVTTRVCYEIYKTNADFRNAFWDRTLGRRGVQVGDTDEFKEMLEGFMAENE
jgi:hypothetical protein